MSAAVPHTAHTGERGTDYKSENETTHACEHRPRTRTHAHAHTARKEKAHAITHPNAGAQHQQQQVPRSQAPFTKHAMLRGVGCLYIQMPKRHLGTHARTHARTHERTQARMLICTHKHALDIQNTYLTSTLPIYTRAREREREGGGGGERRR